MTRPWLIIGRTGQVGSALTGLLGQRAFAVDREELDFLKPSDLARGLDRLSEDKPFSAIVNCAAYNLVDQAESDRESADAINHMAPRALARWCSARRIPLVHYSTDYVFSGEGSAPWKETDTPSPLSCYGRTKHDGERAVQESGCSGYILRTSWVYDSVHDNFISKMIRLGKTKDTLRVVSDQIGSPTPASLLAQVTVALLDSHPDTSNVPNTPSTVSAAELLHVTPDGETSFFEYAALIFERARSHGVPLTITRFEPVKTSDFPTPARRPLNCRLNHEKVKARVAAQISAWPDWRTSVENCLEQMDWGRFR